MSEHPNEADGHPPCPVCLSARTERFMDVDARRYHRCQRCASTFLDPAQLPTPADELAHYETHENNPADPRYRTFLNRLAQPLAAKIAPASRGLDYGCGPGPALAMMLRGAGHSVEMRENFLTSELCGTNKTSTGPKTLNSIATHFTRTGTSKPGDRVQRINNDV